MPSLLVIMYRVLCIPFRTLAKYCRLLLRDRSSPPVLASFNLEMVPRDLVVEGIFDLRGVLMPVPQHSLCRVCLNVLAKLFLEAIMHDARRLLRNL